MTELLHQWIMRLVATALITACAMALTPEGNVKKTVRTVCALAALIALASPLSGSIVESVDQSFDYLYGEAVSASAEFTAINENIEDSIIISELRSYISKEGKALGLDITSFEPELLTFEDGTRRPFSVDITVSGAEENINKLENIIESELGIPKERINLKFE